MNKLRYLASVLAFLVVPACITVQESDDKCDSACAGTKADDMPEAGTSTGGTKANGGTSGSDGTEGGTDGAPDEGMAGQGGTPPTLPTIVSIEVTGILIGPGKVDGTQWDLSEPVPEEVLEALAAALGYPGMGQVLDVVQGAAYQALSKPDAFGVANLNPDGRGFDALFDVALAGINDNTEDSFTPNWPMPFPGWQDLPFEPGLAIRVNVRDEDIALHDDIGTATLNYDDLLEAWLAQDSHWIRVEDQTNEQLIAVQVQVSGVVE